MGNIENRAEPGYEGLGRRAIIAEEPRSHGGTVWQTGLHLPREPSVQHRFIGIVGRKSRAQFILRMRGGSFSVRQKQVSSLDEITEKILQLPISSIVGHEPHAHAGAECLGLSYEPVSRNRVRNLHANFAEP